MWGIKHKANSIESATIFMKPFSTRTGKEVESLVFQLGLDLNLVLHEIQWSLGEERINRVTPSYEQFREWSRQRNGLHNFWLFANTKLETVLSQDSVAERLSLLLPNAVEMLVEPCP